MAAGKGLNYGESVEKKMQQLLRQSIQDLRRIHPGMSDDFFAAWYSRKYKVSEATVRRILEAGKPA